MERPEPARRRGRDELAADGRFRLDRLDVVQALDVSRARSGNSRVALSLVILLLRVLLLRVDAEPTDRGVARRRDALARLRARQRRVHQEPRVPVLR